MRPSKLVAFCLLLILSTSVQGLRLREQLSSGFRRKLQEKRRPSGEDADRLSCWEGRGRCSGKSENHRIDATAPFQKSSRKTLSTDRDSSQNTLHPKEEVVNMSHPASSAAFPNENSSSVSEPYPADLIDIAGMDYSSARKRTPIHN